LVTGEKEIYTMARKSYLAVKLGKPVSYDMVHTENFVLVDAKRRVRGFMTVLIKRISKKLIIDISSIALKKINAFYLFNTKSLILSQDLIYLIVSIK
jgi:protein SCO1/2